ncbi:MAG: hypothetical protein NTU53_12565 [Planctomycetota bacterium]|nr:hypothetical protein [Planctomycetota bacterium]
MLTERPNSVITLLNATYEPQIGYARKLSEVAESVNRWFKNRHWFSTENSYTFRDPDGHFLFTARWNHLFFQTLGLKPWIDRVEEAGEMADKVLTGLNVKQLKSVSFRAQAFVDLEMAHSEIVDRLYATYLADRGELSHIASDFTDAAIALYGVRSGHKFRLSLTPQTPEQVKTSFFAVQNLEHFLVDKFVGNEIRDFWNGIAGKAALNVEIEISEDDLGTEWLKKFMQESISVANELAGVAVKHLLALPVSSSK